MASTIQCIKLADIRSEYWFCANTDCPDRINEVEDSIVHGRPVKCLGCGQEAPSATLSALERFRELLDDVRQNLKDLKLSFKARTPDPDGSTTQYRDYIRFSYLTSLRIRCPKCDALLPAQLRGRSLPAPCIQESRQKGRQHYPRNNNEKTILYNLIGTIKRMQKLKVGFWLRSRPTL